MIEIATAATVSAITATIFMNLMVWRFRREADNTRILNRLNAIRGSSSRS